MATLSSVGHGHGKRRELRTDEGPDVGGIVHTAAWHTLTLTQAHIVGMAWYRPQVMALCVGEGG